jgi:hypothetical protein
MYANRLGRFTGVDPLLSSGRIENPQTWNRYSYTLNNPLIYTDPTGAYVFTDDLGGATSDEDLVTNAGTNKKKIKAANKIVERRHKIRDALVKAKEAGAKSDNPGAVNKAVDAYGGYLTANGVVVGFGDTGGNPGVTRGNNASGSLFGFADGKFTANILVLFKESAGEEDFINAVAHEGQHVSDRQAVADVMTANVNDSNFDFHNSSANVTHRTTEERAYLVTAMVAQGRGQTSWSPGGYEIWNSSWKAAERMDKISKGINKLLTGSKTYKDKLDERIYPK